MYALEDIPEDAQGLFHALTLASLMVGLRETYAVPRIEPGVNHVQGKSLTHYIISPVLVGVSHP